ncbi:MAG: acyl carrier protein [Magnetococcales bacterium]|nr:acyl carrier protein [Magnetococcales bacterium]
MTDNEILDTLTVIFRQVFENNNISATPGLTADDFQEWDSVGHMGLVLAIEKKYNFQFDMGEIGRVNSVDLLLQVIRDKLSKQI